jgi:V-ATPase subunit H
VFLLINATIQILSVQRLVELVSNSSHDDDDDVVAIACYDIGEFVRLYPQGKTIIKQFGTRNVIVNAYNQHEHNSIVRHNALICLSKMLITNWKVCHRRGRGEVFPPDFLIFCDLTFFPSFLQHITS